MYSVQHTLGNPHRRSQPHSLYAVLSDIPLIEIRCLIQEMGCSNLQNAHSLCLVGAGGKAVAEVGIHGARGP